EWLFIDDVGGAGVNVDALATWDVVGARAEKRGDRIVLVDGADRVVVEVSAPASYAAYAGNDVRDISAAVHLDVDADGAVVARVDADVVVGTSAILVDP